MEITEVRVHKVEREGSNLKGFASVTLDNCFVVNNIRIIEGTEGMRIGMPRRKVADEHWEDVAHPINSETRAYFQEEILKKYNEPAE